MNLSRKNFARSIGLLLFIFSVPGATAQEPGYFNNARTRCYGGGMTISKDGKTIFHVEMIKPDSLKPGRLKIMKSEWSKGKWSAPADLMLTTIGQEVSPVLSPDGKRLYFASTGPGPGEQEAGDLNIWYSDFSNGNWGTPVFLEALNSPMADRFTNVDQAGNFYFISNKDGNQDIYITRLTDGNWSTPTTVAAWNSAREEEYVSVNDPLGIAFIQRSEPGVSTDILFSIRNKGEWSEPTTLEYDGKFTQAPYVQRAPMLSPDGGTLYLMAQSLIWQQSTAAIFEKNKIAMKAPKHLPLPVPPVGQDEPEVFGGLKLKTNNGISFTPDMKTIYVSRYTPQKDSAGRQFIKIFESTLSKTEWSDFKLLPFCKPDVPFEYHPVMAQDGKRLFYNSRAPLPGTNAKYVSKNNPWYADKNGYAWSTPTLLSALATEHYDDYASVARSGTLYFRSERPGGLGGGDIYVSRYTGGKYETPELINTLSSMHNENDVCIDPDERFIIFNRYFDATNEIRLFVSIRKQGQWTNPRLVTKLERAVDWELTPSLSPDGKFFFYEVNSNIFWVETSAIFTAEELRELKG